MVALAAAVACAAAVLFRRLIASARARRAAALTPIANRYASPSWTQLDRVSRY